MKRWNGWGNIATIYPMQESALVYLRSILSELSALP